jgi:hypothetical protein
MDFLKKIDIKVLFIFLLLILLLISILTRPNKVNVEYYEDEIKKLNEINNKLYKVNDSLNYENEKLNFTIINIENKIDSIDVILFKNNLEVEKLKNKKSEISNNVIIMGADDVTRSLTEYIKRRN